MVNVSIVQVVMFRKETLKLVHSVLIENLLPVVLNVKCAQIIKSLKKTVSHALSKPVNQTSIIPLMESVETAQVIKPQQVMEDHAKRLVAVVTK